MNMADDTLKLVLPFKAEYVSIARLTVSGVANRIGFDIEAIEDIKVAVSEVCSKLVKVGSTTADHYSLEFILNEDRLTVNFDCLDKNLKCIFDEEEDALGLSIMTALMDDVEFCSESSYLLSMTKAVEGIC